MSCHSLTRGARRGGAFTLLEVMIAVVIVSFLMFSVYRFVRANLVAIRISNQVTRDRDGTSSLVEYVRTQLEDLPVRGQGALLGNPGSYHDLASDELQWVCRAGAGVLTTSAPGEYRVTLAIQPTEKTGSALEIGLRRSATNEDEKKYNWLPLLRPAVALEVRYFDSRLNNWVDRWSDVNLRPSLVRLRIWRNADDPPLEAVIAVPSARSQGKLAAGSIDSALGERWANLGMAPAPAAEPERSVLIHRVYLDSLGVPPTEEETLAFVQDPDPRAIDRLLFRLSR